MRNAGARPEEQAGEHRKAGGEGEHGEVGTCIERNGLAFGRDDAKQQAGSPVGDENARGAADRSEQHALGEHLANEPAAAGADCHAHSDLLLAGRGAGEQQVGNVGAGDQQDHGDDARQHEQGLGEASAQVGGAPGPSLYLDLLVEEFALARGGGVGAGLRLEHLAEDDVEVGLRAGRGEAGFQAAHDMQPHDALGLGVVVAQPEPARHHHGLHHHGEIEGRRLADTFSEKAQRQNANDRQVARPRSERFCRALPRPARSAAPKRGS